MYLRELQTLDLWRGAAAKSTRQNSMSAVTHRALEKVTLAVHLNGQHTWTLELVSTTRLSKLAELLCDHVVREVRPSDYGAAAHMWTFTIGQADASGRTKWSRDKLYSSSYADFGDEFDRDPAVRIGKLRLSDKSRLMFEYDMGDPCRVAMKVVRVNEPTRDPGLPRWVPAASRAHEVLRGSEQWRQLMESVPAAQLPETTRIDDAYGARS